MRRESTGGEPTLGRAGASSRQHLVIVDINGGGHKKLNKVGTDESREKWHGVEKGLVKYKCDENKK